MDSLTLTDAFRAWELVWKKKIALELGIISVKLFHNVSFTHLAHLYYFRLLSPDLWENIKEKIKTEFNYKINKYSLKKINY